MNNVSASPLTWPDGWKRTAEPVVSRFSYNVTISKATNFILSELNKMGIGDWLVIISTNLKLKNNGLPYSVQKEPDDRGASVWWAKNGKNNVIALDKYDKIADNLWAIGKTISSIRGIERWGGGEILERTFSGFAQLTDDSNPSWQELFGYHGYSLSEAKDAYKRARYKSHPDKGGSEKLFKQIADAWVTCQRELI